MRDNGFFRFGKYEVDCASRELRKNGVRLKVDDQPFRLLTELIGRRGDVVTREELRAILWPDGTYVDFDRGLTRAVNKLRLALADDAVNPRFIETIPRRGYRFVAPVYILERSESSVIGSGEPDLVNQLDAAVEISPPQSGNRNLFRLLLWCVCAALLITGFVWYGLQRNTALPVAAAAKRAPVILDPANQALYTKGRFLAAEPSREAIERGIRILEKVIEREPAFAPAHAALAEGWFGLASVYLPPLETMPKARAAARRAIDLDARSEDGRAVLGRVHVFYDWDWTGAEEQFQKALEVDPRSANALKGRACLRMAQGRPVDALHDLDLALRIDPRSLWLHFMAVAFRANARQYDDALKQARASLEWEPRFGMLRSFAGVISAMNGNSDQAVREMEAGVQQQRLPTSIGFLALGNAVAGRTVQAERALNEMLTLAKRQYVCPFEIASAYASLHRKDEAFYWLEKGVAERADCIIWLRAEPWLDPIRDDPRYTRLVSQIWLP